MTADPANDALDRLMRNASRGELKDGTIIREALADRITPAEAHALLKRPHSTLSTNERRSLDARLGRIADRA